MKLLRFFVPVLGLLLPFNSPAANTPSWDEILGPAQGSVPASAAFKVNWRDNLPKALAEAKREKRPLFVTLRCLPCKQCADFDKEVLEGGPDLDPILTQFITVRLINAEHLDFRIFPVEGFQDLDLSWWGWFLSPEGQVYGQGDQQRGLQGGRSTESRFNCRQRPKSQRARPGLSRLVPATI